jgi:hypothetical protein
MENLLREKFEEKVEEIYCRFQEQYVMKKKQQTKMT